MYLLESAAPPVEAQVTAVAPRLEEANAEPAGLEVAGYPLASERAMEEAEACFSVEVGTIEAGSRREINAEALAGKETCPMATPAHWEGREARRSAAGLAGFRARESPICRVPLAAHPFLNSVPKRYVRNTTCPFEYKKYFEPNMATKKMKNEYQ